MQSSSKDDPMGACSKKKDPAATDPTVEEFEQILKKHKMNPIHDPPATDWWEGLGKSTEFFGHF